MGQKAQFSIQLVFSKAEIAGTAKIAASQLEPIPTGIFIIFLQKVAQVQVLCIDKPPKTTKRTKVLI